MKLYYITTCQTQHKPWTIHLVQPWGWKLLEWHCPLPTLQPFISYLLGLLAMIKCSICSYQCDNWYVSHWHQREICVPKCLERISSSLYHRQRTLHVRQINQGGVQKVVYSCSKTKTGPLWVSHFSKGLSKKFPFTFQWPKGCHCEY